jgi:hypothetical protein
MIAFCFSKATRKGDLNVHGVRICMGRALRNQGRSITMRWKLNRPLFGWKTCAFATFCACCLTLYLFLATSKTEPLECTTWAELACLPPWERRGVPRRSPAEAEFCCFSECGRYYAVTQPHIENEKRQTYELAIYETLSKKRVGLVVIYGSYLTDFCISGDGKFLALIWGYYDLQVHRWPSLELVHKLIDLRPSAAFSTQPLPDSRTVLMTTSSSSSFWDLGTGMQLAHHGAKVFLQPDGDLKELRHDYDSKLALWRPKDQVPIWEIEAAPHNTLRAHSYWLDDRSRSVNSEPVASPDGTLLVEVTTRPGIAVRSVDTGEILARSPSTQGNFFGPRFSRDNRFLAFFSIKKHAWNNLLARLPDFVRPDRLGYMDDPIEVVLQDLRSGAAFPGIEGTPREGFAAAPHLRFIEPESRFVTLTDEGMLQWSLPPTRRPFTAWAWTGLCCFVVLGGCWWRMGTSNAQSA